MTQYKIVKKAPIGIVTNQEVIILIIALVFICLAPFANPTPITPPTSVWVVEIGNPTYEATTTVVAVASSAEKPRLGFNAVIFSPTVFITFFPSMLKPKTIPVAPKKRIQAWTGESVSIIPFEFTVDTTAARGPIAFATSFEPCAKAIAHAEITIKIANADSTPSFLIFIKFRLKVIEVMTAARIPKIELNIYISDSTNSSPKFLSPFLAITNEIIKAT